MTIKYTLDKKKNEYDEYIVKAFVNGKFDDDKSYYTDEWDDAVETLRDMAKRDGLSVSGGGSKYVADSTFGIPSSRWAKQVDLPASTLKEYFTDGTFEVAKSEKLNELLKLTRNNSWFVFNGQGARQPLSGKENRSANTDFVAFTTKPKAEARARELAAEHKGESFKVDFVIVTLRTKIK